MPHFQLVVPNYDKTGTAQGQPLTYVRLGASWDENETLPSGDRGDELVTGTSFMDDARHSSGRTKPGKTYYRDDAADCVTKTPSELTAELLIRGGVREHTDGNRISTTRGDCVEVVGGNYKLVIMGRVVGDHVGASNWESSGGHNHDSTSTPGEVTSITWSTSEDGTWQVTEETEKGEVHSYYYGRNESQFYGPSKIERVGETVRPAIKDVTYAQSIDSLTVVDTANETTAISGSKTETKTCRGRLRDALYYKSGNTSTVEDNTGTKANPVGSFSSHLLAGVITSQSSFALHYEKYAGDFTIKLTIGTELTVGFATEFTLRHLHFKFALEVAYAYELNIAAKLGVTVGVFGKIDCMYEEKVNAAANYKVTLATIGSAITRRKLRLAEAKTMATSSRTHASSNST